MKRIHKGISLMKGIHKANPLMKEIHKGDPLMRGIHSPAMEERDGFFFLYFSNR